jgi:hypothetical protein
MRRRVRMAGCGAVFAAALAVAALTGHVTVVHIVAMGTAFLAASAFVSYLVADSDGANGR